MAYVQAPSRNLRKKFQYAILWRGIEVGLIQKFKFPKLEWEIAEFGGAGTYWNCKERGRLKVSNAELYKAVKSDDVDEFSYVQFMKALGAPPLSYQDSLTIRELKNDSTGARQWTLNYAWAQGLDIEEYDGNVSDMMIEQLSIVCESVDFDICG